jgi:hypothetical protein
MIISYLLSTQNETRKLYQKVTYTRPTTYFNAWRNFSPYLSMPLALFSQSCS